MGWIGVDLDGTLAEYQSGQWPEIGEPIQPMLDRVFKWLEDGEEVRILTARAAHGDSEVERVTKWLVDVAGLPRLQVTAMKDPDMDVLWDDKAIQVKPNTGEPIVDAELQESYARTIRWVNKGNKRKGPKTDSNSFELMASLEHASKLDERSEEYGDLQNEAFALMKGLEKDSKRE